MLVRDGSAADDLRFERAYQLSRYAYALAAIDRDQPARDSYQRAIDDLQELRSRGRGDGADARYLLARVQHNLGYLCVKARELDEADEYYRKSLEIRRALLEQDPRDTTFQSGLAQLHNDIGFLRQLEGRLDEALEHNQTALSLRRAVLKAHPSIHQYERDVASSHNHLGDVHRAAKDWDSAIREYGNALRLQKLLVNARPTVLKYQEDLGNTFLNLGQTYHQSPRHGNALRPLLAARELYAALVRADQTTPGYRKTLAMTLQLVTAAALHYEEYEDVIRYSHEAVQATAEWADRYPEASAVQIAHPIAKCCYWRGRALERLTRHEESLEAYAQAVRRQAEAFRESGESAGQRRWLRTFYRKQADALVRLGRFDEALTVCGRHRDLWPGHAAELLNLSRDLARYVKEIDLREAEDDRSLESMRQRFLDEALRTLMVAVEAGLQDPAELAHRDFAPLRPLKGFAILSDDPASSAPPH